MPKAKTPAKPAKPAKTTSKPAAATNPAVEHVCKLLLDAADLVGVKKPSLATKLSKVLEGPDGLGEINWLLILTSLEIDLRIDISDELAEAHEMSIGEFAERIAALDEVEEDNWTLVCLSVLAEQFLCCCEEDDQCCGNCDCDCDCDEPEEAAMPAKAAKAAKPAKAAKAAKAAKPAKAVKAVKAAKPAKAVKAAKPAKAAKAAKPSKATKSSKKK
jgi:hypothetical protein